MLDLEQLGCLIKLEKGNLRGWKPTHMHARALTHTCVHIHYETICRHIIHTHNRYDLGFGAQTVVHGNKFYNDGKPHLFLRRRHKIRINVDEYDIPFDEVASEYGLTSVFLATQQ